MYYGGQAALLPSFASSLSSSSLSTATEVTVNAENLPVATPSFLSATFEYPTPSPLATPSSEQGSSSDPTFIVVTPSNSSELQPPMRVCGINPLLSTFISFVATSGLFRDLDQTCKPKFAERVADIGWIENSSSWLDRTLCRSIGICWLSHLNQDHWKTNHNPTRVPSWERDDRNTSAFWMSGLEDPTTWSDQERLLRVIPQYILDHAPYVHLYSEETYWPGDIADHLVHTTPHVNYTPVEEQWQHPDLNNLDELNRFGRQTFLQSDDNVEDDPDWLLGESNIPGKSDGSFRLPDGVRHDPGVVGHWSFHPEKQPKYHDPNLDKFFLAGKDGSSDESHRNMGTKTAHQEGSSDELRKRSVGGRSNAPVVLLVVDKGNDVVDAFWFYFYSYNLGNAVFSVRFGNHVGDWEHTAIRFHKGVPKLVFFSEHDFGEAYSWEAVEKYGDRVSDNFPDLFQPRLLTVLACVILGSRHSRNVRYTRHTYLRTSVWHSLRHHGQRPVVGPAS